MIKDKMLDQIKKNNPASYYRNVSFEHGKLAEKCEQICHEEMNLFAIFISIQGYQYDPINKVYFMFNDDDKTFEELLQIYLKEKENGK